MTNPLLAIYNERSPHSWDNEADKSWRQSRRKRFDEELQRQQSALREFLPALRQALNDDYRKELDSWIESPPCKKVRLEADMKEVDVQFWLDMEGYDGWYIDQEHQKEAAKNAIANFIKQASVIHSVVIPSVKTLLQAIINGDPGQDHDALFTAWAIAHEDGLSENAGILFMIEYDKTPDHFYDYFWGISDDATIPECWNLVRHLLPDSLVEILEHKP